MVSLKQLPSLDLLQSFETVARHLSFTNAARELHITQSAVSHQIRSLESQLGVSLFLRQNRRVLLSPEGQVLFPAVRAKEPDWEIAVMGVSCRQQIEHGTGRRARHLAEVLCDALPDSSHP